jgi:hypothetical protein
METITVPNVDVVAYAKGGSEVFRGKLTDFPAHIIAQAAAYAIHKKVQDATGGADMKADEVATAAKAAIDSLKAGTWAKRGGGARATTAEAYIAKQAATWIAAHRKAKGKYAEWTDDKLVPAVIAKLGDTWRAQYEANKAGKGDIDLGD